MKIAFWPNSLRHCWKQWLFGVRFSRNELHYSKWEVQIELGPLGALVIYKHNKLEETVSAYHR